VCLLYRCTFVPYVHKMPWHRNLSALPCYSVSQKCLLLCLTRTADFNNVFSNLVNFGSNSAENVSSENYIILLP